MPRGITITKRVVKRFLLKAEATVNTQWLRKMQKYE